MGTRCESVTAPATVMRTATLKRHWPEAGKAGKRDDSESGNLICAFNRSFSVGGTVLCMRIFVLYVTVIWLPEKGSFFNA